MKNDHLSLNHESMTNLGVAPVEEGVGGHGLLLDHPANLLHAHVALFAAALLRHDQLALGLTALLQEVPLTEELQCRVVIQWCREILL